MSVYPEHEKLEKIKDFSQKCGEFLDWLQHEKGLFLATYSGEEGDELYRADETINQLLVEFFGIDLKKLEAEKLKMLDEIRQLQLEINRQARGEKV